MNVDKVMSHGVRAVRDTDSIDVAIRLMLEAGYSGLPVIDSSGGLVGIVTEGDLLRRAELGTQHWHPGWLNFLLGPTRLAREYTSSHAQKVRDVMSTEVVSVTEATALTKAVGLMEEHHIKRLPVLSEGRVVGMLSRADLLRACLSAIEERHNGVTVSDEVIRQCVETEIRAQAWGPRVTVDVRISKGTVELHGVVTSEAMRDALRVLAENVPGVVAVVDQLTTVEPMTGYIVRAPADAG